MHLRFEINSLADAQRAAAVCQNLVLAFGGENHLVLPPVFSRAEVESYVKATAIERGIIWVREHVFNKYNVKKPSDLTDAQLVELAGFMRETTAPT